MSGADWNGHLWNLVRAAIILALGGISGVLYQTAVRSQDNAREIIHLQKKDGEIESDVKELQETPVQVERVKNAVSSLDARNDQAHATIQSNQEKFAAAQEKMNDKLNLILRRLPIQSSK